MYYDSLLVLIHIDTTDVQTITVLVQEDISRFTLQCSFMDDSNAQGCMVVLVSSFGMEKRNLTRSETQSVEAMNVMYPLSCYSRVYGYDIESDGSLGTLAVPGIIIRNSSGFVLCVPEELIPRPSKLSWIPLSFLAGIARSLSWMYY